MIKLGWLAVPSPNKACFDFIACLWLKPLYHIRELNWLVGHRSVFSLTRLILQVSIWSIVIRLIIIHLYNIDTLSSITFHSTKVLDDSRRGVSATPLLTVRFQSSPTQSAKTANIAYRKAVDRAESVVGLSFLWCTHSKTTILYEWTQQQQMVLADGRMAHGLKAHDTTGTKMLGHWFQKCSIRLTRIKFTYDQLIFWKNTWLGKPILNWVKYLVPHFFTARFGISADIYHRAVMVEGRVMLGDR